MNDNTQGGWIKIYRKMLSWEWYTDINTFKLWMHLLLVANTQDKKWKGITICRGQVVTSLSHLAKQSGLSTQSTRTSLKKLELTQNITRTSTSKYTIITVKKYDEYQEVTCKLTNEQQTSNKRLTNEQQQLKNIENIKNDKKRENITRARTREETLTLGRFQNVFLTQSEIDELKAKYPNEYTAKIERLSRYLTNSGKTYANHFAVLTDWLEKDTSTMKKEKTKSSASYDIAEYERSMFDD